MRALYLLFFIIATLSETLNAIVVIAPRDVGEKTGYSGELAAALSSSKGNSNTSGYDVSGALYYDSNKTVTTAVINYSFAQSDGEAYANKRFLYLRSVYPITGNLYKEYFIQHNSDIFSSLEKREFVGGGVRYKTGDKNEKRTYAGFGVIGVREKNSGLKTESFWAYSTYINHIQLFDNNKRFFTSFYYIPHANNLGAYRATGTASLDIPLSSNFSLSYSLNFERNSKRLPSTKQTDTWANLEFKYSF
jgi:hypothetical protein